MLLIKSRINLNPWNILPTPGIRAVRIVYRKRKAGQLRQELAMWNRRLAIVEKRLAIRGDDATPDDINSYATILGEVARLEREIGDLEPR